MRDRPIIFSRPMVRALLNGWKTQTRRLASSPLRRAATGDRLYVREEWRIGSKYDDASPRDLEPRSMSVLFGAGGSIARSENNDWSASQWPEADALPSWAGRRRASMHMPRWASRLTLVIEEVRFQRLQTISHDDARSEGIERDGDGWREYTGRPIRPLGARECFASLWASLHQTDGQRWEDDPEIVALTFSVHHCNIDRMPK